jgi:hypothetical protein
VCRLREGGAKGLRHLWVTAMSCHGPVTALSDPSDPLTLPPGVGEGDPPSDNPSMACRRVDDAAAAAMEVIAWFAPSIRAATRSVC